MSEELKYYCKTFNITEEMQKEFTGLEELYNEMGLNLVDEVLEMGNETSYLKDSPCKDKFLFNMGVVKGMMMY